MSSLTVQTLTNGAGVQIPIYTDGDRPPVEEGLMIYNSTVNLVQVGSSTGEWVNIGSPESAAEESIDGLTAGTAFATLDQVSGLYSGTQILYTTFNNSTQPTEVLVNFDVPSGPWFVVSFVMPEPSAWVTDNVNGTVAAGVYSNNNSTNSSTTRPRRTGTVPNMGTRQVGQIFTPNQIESVTNSSSRGWYVGGAGYNTGWQTIEYYNHATQSNFSLSEITGLRSVVTQLSSYTPHCGLEIDAQGLGSPTDWRSDFTGNIGGHANWLRLGNNYMRSTPSENRSDERGAAWFWTHNTYQPELFGGGSFDYAVSGGTPTGLPPGFILPDAIKFSGTTGGGSMFGTPYMNFSGFENRLNNRNFFLCK